MKKIPLTQGQFALVDDDDYERVSALKWCAIKWGGGYYAARSERVSMPVGIRAKKNILLHRFVTSCPVGFDVDHKNHNGLDCRRANLRICTRSQNQMNRRGVAGIAWHKRDKKFTAQIMVNGKTKYLGYHSTMRSALNSRRQAELFYFGEFSCH